MMYLVFLCLATMLAQSWAYKTFCVYHRNSYIRKDSGELTVDKLKTATDKYCSHLVLSGFVDMGDDGKLTYVHGDEDLWSTNIGALKETEKGQLKILVSIGGSNKPNDRKYQRYFNMMRSDQDSKAFIQNVKLFLGKHDIDGVEIAWGLSSENKGRQGFKQVRTTAQLLRILALLFRSFKTQTYQPAADQPTEKQTQYMNFIGLLGPVLKENNKMLTLGLHSEFVNSDYYDVQELMRHVHYVILWAIDFVTPAQTSKEAIPIAEDVVKAWLGKSTSDSQKIVLGVGTWGLTWDPKKKSLSKIQEEEDILIPDSLEKNENIAGFDTPRTAKKKVLLIRKNHLGGAGILDIGLEDFNGLFGAGEFPIVKAVYMNLHLKKESQQEASVSPEASRAHANKSPPYVASSELPNSPIPQTAASALPRRSPLYAFNSDVQLPPKRSQSTPHDSNELPQKGGTSQSIVAATQLRFKPTRRATIDDLPVYTPMTLPSSSFESIGIDIVPPSIVGDRNDPSTPQNSQLLTTDVRKRHKDKRTTT